MEKKTIIIKRVLREIIQKSLILDVNLYKGAVVEFALAQKLTKFDIYSILYSLRSKKQRSHEIQVRSGGNLPYQYMGKILSIKTPFKDKLESSIILRNVIELISFEINIKIFSPLITKMEIKILDSKNIKPFARSNSFFLRKAPPAKSKTNFNYVITA